MAKEKYLIVVGGTTASGKTGFAIRLAQYFNTSILSVDSRQFYHEMTIGTARPTTDELAQAPHHFIGHRSIFDTYSAGDFEAEAMTLLDQLFQEKDVVIACGGSGLYLKAIIEGLDNFPDVPITTRKTIEKEYEEKGLNWLQATLKEVDPAYCEIVDMQNPHRLIRALSVYQASGKAFSSYRQKQASKRDFQAIYLQLYWPREQQYERINQRVDLMMQAGQLEEAQRLFSHRELSALQTVGYQELFDHLDGKSTLEEAVDLIKRNTRRYAKRQLTWMRRDKHWKHLHPSEWELACSYIEWVRQNNTQFRMAAVEEITELPKDWPETDISPHIHGKLDILLGLKAGEIIAQLPIQSFKKEVLLLPIIGRESIPHPLAALLWHEALAWTEERTTYIANPVKKPPILPEEIQLSAPSMLPPKIEAFKQPSIEVSLVHKNQGMRDK